MWAADYASLLSQPLAYAACAVALVAGALLLLPFSRLFRSRLRAPVGGDARRLSIAGSFVLGRWRELVVIRRDDVEHMVMTGGPTDVVIETILDDTGLEISESDIAWLDEQSPDEVHPGRIRLFLEGAKRIIGAEGLIPLALLSGAAGAGAGVICGLFRLALEKADRFRSSIPLWWQDRPLLGLSLLIAGASAAAALSALLVRRYSVHAAGSGIPQIEAAIRGDLSPAPLVLLPVKFFGGLLAIGAGLASLACKWAQHLLISSEKNFAGARATAAHCSRPARAPGLPPHSTHRSQDLLSCWKSFCEDSRPAMSLPPLELRAAQSSWPGFSSGPHQILQSRIFFSRRSAIISYVFCWASSRACVAPFTTALYLAHSL